MEESVFKDDIIKEGCFALLSFCLATFLVGFVFLLIGSVISEVLLVRLLFLGLGISLVVVFFLKKVKLEYHLIYKEFVLVKQLFDFSSLRTKKISFDSIKRVELSKVWGGGKTSNYGYFIVLLLNDDTLVFLKFSEERLSFFRKVSQSYGLNISEVWTSVTGYPPTKGIHQLKH